MNEAFKIVLNSKSENEEEFNKILQDNLKVSLEDCVVQLNSFLRDRSQDVLKDMFNLAPYGDYSKYTEDLGVILNFLQNEAAQAKNWKVNFSLLRKKDDELIELIFNNIAVDDGDILQGYVFIGLSGKIRHAFVQAGN